MIVYRYIVSIWTGNQMTGYQRRNTADPPAIPTSIKFKNDYIYIYLFSLCVCLCVHMHTWQNVCVKALWQPVVVGSLFRPCGFWNWTQILGRTLLTGLSCQSHVLADCVGIGKCTFVPTSQSFGLFRFLSPGPTSQGPSWQSWWQGWTMVDWSWQLSSQGDSSGH